MSDLAIRLVDRARTDVTPKTGDRLVVAHRHKPYAYVYAAGWVAEGSRVPASFPDDDDQVVLVRESGQTLFFAERPLPGLPVTARTQEMFSAGEPPLETTFPRGGRGPTVQTVIDDDSVGLATEPGGGIGIPEIDGGRDGF